MVLPVLLSRSIAEITATLLLARAKRFESRGALDIAKRSLQTCGQLMRFAVTHGVIECNPSADVKPSDAQTPSQGELRQAGRARGSRTAEQDRDLSGQLSPEAGHEADGAHLCANGRAGGSAHASWPKPAHLSVGSYFGGRFWPRSDASVTHGRISATRQ